MRHRRCCQAGKPGLHSNKVTPMIRVRLLIIVFMSAAIAIPVGAGDKKKDDGPGKVERGEEHKVLESLVGAFDADVKVYFPDPTKPHMTKGVMTRTMILGGNFLQ